MTREVLAGHLHSFTQVYLDDILVYSKNLTEHKAHLRAVFERLRQHNLRASFDKCTIATDNIEYLGHNIQGSVTTPLNKHLANIRNFPVPRTKRQVQSFLGVFNWIREYIADAAHLTRPITDLLKNNKPFKWTPECQAAFDRLKEEASRPLQLHRPDFTRTFYLQVDASAKGLGAVLFQKDGDGNKQVISYSSATLKPNETKYHINELEVFAAIYGIKKYRGYLADKPFVLITDSKSLYWLEKNRDAKAKLTRWSILLQEYNFTVEHCTGKENQLADFLSRNATEERADDVINEERLLPPELPKHRVINALTADQLYEEITRAQRRSRRIQNKILMWHDIARHGPQNRREARFHEEHTVDDGVLYYVKNNERKLVVPRKKMTRLTFEHHDVADAAHPGVDETVRAIQTLYHADKLRKYVLSYVKQCVICHTVKTRQLQTDAPMRPHLSKSPFEVISIDILGPYPTSKQGNRFIIVVEDIFTKWLEARAVPSAEADKVVSFIENDIISRYGSPREIITDNGSVFQSQTYTDMCDKYHAKPLYTAVYFQRENPVERKVAELKKTLRTLQVHDYPRTQWDEYLPKALSILRSRKNRATGMTPVKALLGYEATKRGEWGIFEYQRRRRGPRASLRERRRIIRTRQLEFNEKTYPAQDQIPAVTFRRGDNVLVRDHNPTDPFAPAWSGPHQIAHRWSPQVYEVDKNGRQFRYHVDQLRPAPPGNREPDTDSDSDPDDDPPNAPIPDNDDPSSEDEAPTQVTPDLPRVPPGPPDNDTSSEDEGPTIIVTKAQIHADPQVRDIRPADTEASQPRARPQSGKPALSRRPPEIDDGSMESPTRDPERPDRRPTPPEFGQPGPVALYVPPRRRAAYFTSHQPDVISVQHEDVTEQ